MSYPRTHLRRAGRIAILTAAVSLALAGGFASTASASTIDPLHAPQPISNADANLGGANGQCPGGLYCSTRDGPPSWNGNDNGNAVGRPGAGEVGKADNKNPPGQMQAPAGSDHNAGYECDRNNGIGKSNPAHTGCVGRSIVPPVVTPVVPAVVTPVVAGSVITPARVLGAVVNAQVVLSAAEVAAHPLPLAAAAGQANTSGLLADGGFASLAGFLALGTAFVMRRRHGVE